MIREEIGKTLLESPDQDFGTITAADSAADAAIENLSRHFDFEDPTVVDEFHPELAKVILDLLRLHGVKRLAKQSIFDAKGE